jgi:molybdopterin converting factor small subunit
MEIPDRASVRDLLIQLEIGPNELKIVFLNGVHAGQDQMLKDGDRIAVFPPIAGG